MEAYQPIYDAVRSKIIGGDVNAAIENAVHSLGLGHITHLVECAMQEISAANTAPHVLLKPSLGVDGNMWSVLYGDNIMEGCVGYGETPAKAMADFDHNWYSQKQT